jgi:prepilin-type N-terminal cleavage/methylation domain-containing protein
LVFKEIEVRLRMGKCRKKRAFTLIELLTVMGILVVLVTLLVPSLNSVRRYVKDTKQKNQFHAIEIGLDLYVQEGKWEEYPDSDQFDSTGTLQPYNGAMKLCEALMGQDLMGFHPASQFRNDGMDASGTEDLYPEPIDPSDPLHEKNLRERKGPYLQVENADAYKLLEIYSSSILGTTELDRSRERYVLCDVYGRVRNTQTGKIIGTPILYYKANTFGNVHDILALEEDKIYNHLDNFDLTELGVPSTGAPHGLYEDPNEWFYSATTNEKIEAVVRPYNQESYILLSAGFDGEYGTPDDVFNFEKK